MRLIRFILIQLLLLTSAFADQGAGENNAYLRFGGACGLYKDLDGQSSPIMKKARESGQFAIYDSFHQITKSGDEKYNPEKNAPGGEEHLKVKMSELMEQFKKKDCLKENCQLIINLPVHGFPKDQSSLEDIGLSQKDEFKQMNHGICLSDGKRLDINFFEPYLKELKDKGVKIGVISEACFGGGAVDVLGQYGCILTATGSNAPHVLLGRNSFGGTIRPEDEALSLTDMAIRQLVNANHDSLLSNVPIVSSPDDDDILKNLNKASDYYTNKKQKLFMKKLLKKTKNMDSKQFQQEALLCSKVIKCYKGKLWETLSKEEKECTPNNKFCPEFSCEEKKLCTGEDSPYVNFNPLRNHMDELDKLDWNKFDIESFRTKLTKCETSAISETAFNDLLKINQVLADDAKKVIGEENLKKWNELFNSLNFDHIDFNEFGFSRELTNAQVNCKNIQSPPSGFKDCAADSKCCLNTCSKHLMSSDNMSKTDQYSIYLGAKCLNLIKAAHLVGRKWMNSYIDKKISKDGAPKDLKVLIKKTTCDEIILPGKAK